jgi:hypothetical protein
MPAGPAETSTVAIGWKRHFTRHIPVAHAYRKPRVGVKPPREVCDGPELFAVVHSDIGVKVQEKSIQYAALSLSEWQIEQSRRDVVQASYACSLGLPHLAILPQPRSRIVGDVEGRSISSARGVAAC